MPLSCSFIHISLEDLAYNIRNFPVVDLVHEKGTSKIIQFLYRKNHRFLKAFREDDLRGVEVMVLMHLFCNLIIGCK